jgi:hypothetical protein
MADEDEVKLARKILDALPKMRDSGVDTMWMVERNRKKKQAEPADATGFAAEVSTIAEQLAKDERALDEQRALLRERARHAVEEWLTKHDPERSQASTHEVFERPRAKAFFERIGLKLTK